MPRTRPGSAGRGRARPRRALLGAGTAASTSPTSRPTRSSTPSPTTSWPRATCAEALRRLMERGWRTGDPTRGDMAGLRDLMERLERRREEALERYGLDDVLGDIRRQLDEIVAEERAGRRAAARRGVADRRGPEPDPTRHDRPGAALDAPRRRRSPARPARRACRPTSASGSAGCRTTTSSSRRRASASTSSSSALQGQVLDQFVVGHVRRDPVDDARRISPPTGRWCATSTS